MAGYTRQSTADIIPTATVRAAPINAEYNAIRDAFAASGGHKHDGTTGEGEYIPLIADLDALNKIQVDTNNNRFGVFIEVGATSVEQVRFQDGAIVPVTDNDIDLGTSSLEFKNLYLDGTAYIDSLVADTADINAGTIDNTVIGGTTAVAANFTTLGASGNATVGGTLGVTGLSTLASVDINGGAIDGTTIGATSHTTGKFTTLQSTGQATLATVNIDGGTIDGTTIGATTATSGAFTTVSASTGFTGDVTGNLTGNVTGNVTGNLTGNVTGDLTGNVTASTGSSTFNNVTINGTLDVTSTRITNVVDPTAAQDAATKNYVDTEITNLIGGAPGALDTLNELAEALNDDANAYTTLDTKINTKVSKAGDTMSGALAMGTNKITGLGTPTANTDAATKGYVDTQRDTRLATAGGTMTGNISMGANKITSTATPTADDDLTRKAYVDSILGSATAASASAAAAATSESNAATSETNAASSAASAAASYDSFDDRYLGSKASAPTVDNDGNALLTGALYWNSTDDKMYVYDGSSWNVVNPSLVGDASPQLGGDLDTNGNNISFDDNDKAIFGAGSDLQIYHDGSNSYIDDAGTGLLRLRSNQIYLEKYTGEIMAALTADAGVNLRYDNAIKLETTSTGIDVTGNATFADNGKAIFGAGSDLQIYHDGSSSIIQDNGTGHLRLHAGSLRIRNSANTEALISADEDGAVELFYNGVEKLATTATGIDVTGVITTDGMTTSADINFGDNDKAIFGAGSDLQIYHTGAHSYIDDQGTGNLYLNSNGSGTIIQGGGTQARFFNGAGVDLWYNNEVRLATTSTGIDVTGDITLGDNNPTITMNDSSATGLYHEIKSSSDKLVISADAGDVDAGTKIELLVDGTEIVDVSSTGIDVTGTAVADAFSGPLTGNVTGNITGNVTGNVTGDLTGDVDLQAIAATIADTAVDIFVYDTRKDSDGGAWRKRTQHTSWYNETLNTATRGSRKEFPAVAVIVADNVDHTVTIYDGDDPSLPMWMVFTDWDFRPTSRMIGTGDNGTVTACLAMLNGKLAVGVEGAAGSAGSWDGLYEIDFLKDHAIHRNVTSTTYGVWDGNISTRNSGGYPATNAYSVPAIVNTQVNDVAMTVLPNAPIDAATGLPVPTIAVATDGGVSVIKDDGTVVDITHSSYTQTEQVLFPKNGGIAYTTDNSGNQRWLHVDHAIPSSDVSKGLGYVGTDSDEMYHTVDGSQYGNQRMKFNLENLRKGLVLTKDDGLASGSDSSYGGGIVLISRNKNKPEAGMSAEISSTFNTGWLVGGGEAYTPSDAYPNKGAVLATLSDTDDTNVTGSELVTNGDFASTDLSDWSEIEVGSGTATFTVTSGALHINLGGSYDTGVGQGITTVIGETYVLSFDLSFVTNFNSANNVQYSAGTTLNSTNNGSANATTDGTYSLTFTATATTTWVNFRSASSSNTTGEYTLDNVSVRLAEEDRSVNGNGLQVFGTVTKSAVSSGADLVAYSGFSASNYLMQPYNSDLDFGTGDFCVMGWQKGTDSIGPFLTRNRNSSTHLFTVGSYAADKVWFSTGDSAGNKTTIQTDITTPTIDDNVWNCWCFVRRNGILEVWLGGVLQGTKSGTVRDVSSTDAVLYVATDGPSTNYGGDYTGSLALWRISATAPSPEQIKKIYEDEKVLFQEGAQATLYGSSDAVTALAYDDSTNLLHVGTSAGRSVFQGLRRVDNTTTAVSAAISASNEMVAEQ